MDHSIGANIRRLRGKMTQRELAEKASAHLYKPGQQERRRAVSIDVIRKLEQGARQTASLETLQAVAAALDVPLADLLGKKTSLPESPANEGVIAIRHALADADDLIPDIGEEEALTLRDAERAVDYCWGAYWSGRYDLLGQVLPATLPQLRATVRAVPAADRPKAAEALARGYQVAGDTLVHFGQQDAAWMAIRHAIAAAQQGDDGLLDAALRISVAWQLLVQGRWGESERVAIAAAEGIEPRGDASTSQVTAYGILAVTGATAAARAQRAGATRDLLQVASEMAGRIGPRDRSDHQTTFGPAKVTMLEVDCHVVQEEYGRALTAAKRMPRDAVLPRATRARHLADIAFSQMRLGRDQESLRTLLAMEAGAPDWIKYQTLPRQTAAELVERGRRLPDDLRGLAQRLGVR